MKYDRRVSKLTQFFFKKYLKIHLYKWLVDKKLNRPLAKILYKIIYWFVLKPFNRIELINKDKIRHLKEPFLIVENHIAGLDVIIHLAIWAHLGKTTFTFVWVGEYLTQALYEVLMLSEMIIKHGEGKRLVQQMVDRLKEGDIVNIFPEGTFPGGKYYGTGLVQEGFTGAARVAFEYEKQTGKKLKIIPVATTGTNYAYPPKERAKRQPAAKIKVFFGDPFTLSFKNKEFNKEEIEQNTDEIMHRIADLIGQKRLIPNYLRRWYSEQSMKTRKF
jgi:1-acyl-sn-glycerol-3-phosphate acyltransferase